MTPASLTDPAPLDNDLPPPQRGFRMGLSGIQLLLAVCCWTILLAIVYATSPDETLPRTLFFVALFGALFFTLAPILRAISLRLAHSRIYQQAAGRHTTRQAALLATFVVLNALLQMVRTWSEFNALLLFGTFAVMEVVALSRR